MLIRVENGKTVFTDEKESGIDIGNYIVEVLSFFETLGMEKATLRIEVSQGESFKKDPGNVTFTFKGNMAIVGEIEEVLEFFGTYLFGLGMQVFSHESEHFEVQGLSRKSLGAIKKEIEFIWGDEATDEEIKNTLLRECKENRTSFIPLKAAA